MLDPPPPLKFMWKTPCLSCMPIQFCVSCISSLFYSSYFSLFFSAYPVFYFKWSSSIHSVCTSILPFISGDGVQFIPCVFQSYHCISTPGVWSLNQLNQRNADFYTQWYRWRCYMVSLQWRTWYTWVFPVQFPVRGKYLVWFWKGYSTALSY